MSAIRRLLVVALLVGIDTAGVSSQADLDVTAARAKQIAFHTIRLETEQALVAVEQADRADPRIMQEEVRLSIYRGDCDRAARVAASPRYPSNNDEALAMAKIATSCARIIAGATRRTDEGRGIEIIFQAPSDEGLFEELAMVIAQAREAITQELGVDWPRPTRLLIVRDQLSLSASTGLPYEAARTTGTAGIAKWGRVAMLSPAASPHGFAWRDTLAHELTHLGVTRATIDRAPLWLQEGLAKRLETRWRAPKPFDERSAPEDAVLVGIDKKIDLPLDKLGPSLAMLPSAEQAAVAYAEVVSFVGYYADHAADGALRKLLSELQLHEVDDALRTASGSDLGQWDKQWRAWLARRMRPVKATPPPRGEGLSSFDAVRLSELLQKRGHLTAALDELDRHPKAHEQPSYAHARARVFEALAQSEKAWSAVADPRAILHDFGPWWATRARLATNQEVANTSFDMARGHNPLDFETACEVNKGTNATEAQRKKPLCQCAIARGEPSTEP